MASLVVGGGELVEALLEMRELGDFDSWVIRFKRKGAAGKAIEKKQACKLARQNVKLK